MARPLKEAPITTRNARARLGRRSALARYRPRHASRLPEGQARRPLVGALARMVRVTAKRRSARRTMRSRFGTLDYNAGRPRSAGEGRGSPRGSQSQGRWTAAYGPISHRNPTLQQSTLVIAGAPDEYCDRLRTCACRDMFSGGKPEGSKRLPQQRRWPTCRCMR